MEFRLPGFNAQLQQNQVYSIPNFSNQAMEVGRPVDLQREAIQRELEKEMIREKIIAEELERFRVLQADPVRRELMMGRELMATRSANGFPSSAFMVGHQITNSFRRADKPNLSGAGTNHHHYHHYY